MQHSLGTGWSWCAVTILGLAVGVQSGFLLGWIVVMWLNLPQWGSLWLADGLMGLLGGAWVGGVTGTAQLLVLSRYAPRSWRWVLLSAGGWGGSMVGFALARLLLPLGTYLGISAVAASGLELVGLIFGLAIAGIITGIGLSQLIKE